MAELLARLSDIPASGLLAVTRADGSRLVVVRHGEAVWALDDECTHQAMPLSAGELCDDGTIECPWHGARFDCATGACRRGPATDDVRAYAVEVLGGAVMLID